MYVIDAFCFLDDSFKLLMLLLTDVPTIMGLKEFSFSHGQKATVTCEAQCVPKPTEVVWRRERTGEIINNGDSPRWVLHNLSSELCLIY